MSRTAYVMRGEQEAAPSPNHSLSTVDPTVSGLKAHPAPTHTHTHTHTHTVSTPPVSSCQLELLSLSLACVQQRAAHTHTHTNTHTGWHALTFHSHRAAPQLWSSLRTQWGNNRAARRECESQRSQLIVPCLACYHHFAAGEPERTAAATAAAAPQRILGSVVLSAFLGEGGKERRKEGRKEGQVSDVFCREGRKYMQIRHYLK